MADSTMAKREKEWNVLAGRACELARQMKALEEERRNITAVLLARLDEEQIREWHDEFYGVSLVEQPGREVADMPALKAAGLVQFIKQTAPSRYALPRRL